MIFRIPVRARPTNGPCPGPRVPPGPPPLWGGGPPGVRMFYGGSSYLASSGWFIYNHQLSAEPRIDNHTSSTQLGGYQSQGSTTVQPPTTVSETTKKRRAASQCESYVTRSPLGKNEGKLYDNLRISISTNAPALGARMAIYTALEAMTGQ